MNVGSSRKFLYPEQSEQGDDIKVVGKDLLQAGCEPVQAAEMVQGLAPGLASQRRLCSQIAGADPSLLLTVTP